MDQAAGQEGIVVRVHGSFVVAKHAVSGCENPPGVYFENKRTIEKNRNARKLHVNQTEIAEQIVSWLKIAALKVALKGTTVTDIERYLARIYH